MSEEFRRLLLHIGKSITKENVRLMRYLCSDLVPHGRDLSNPQDFIQYFEECGLVNMEDMSFLAEVLYRINRHDLLKRLPGVKNRRDYERNFMRSGSKLNFSLYRLACFQLATELSQTDLEMLRSLSRSEVSTYNYQRSTDPVTFLICLEEEDLLSEEDLEFLHEILGHLDNKHPQQIIDDFRKRSEEVVGPERDFASLQIAQSHSSQRLFHQSTSMVRTPNDDSSSRFFQDEQPPHQQIYQQPHQVSTGTHCYKEPDYRVAEVAPPNNMSWIGQQPRRVENTTTEPPPLDFVAPTFVVHQCMDDDPQPKEDRMKKLDSGKWVRATPPHTHEDVESDTYRIEKCGYCVIINNEKFEDSTNVADAKRRLASQHEVNQVLPNIGFQDREGSGKDVAAIKDLFTKLGFRVRVHENLDQREMKKVLEEYAQTDHSDMDCFVCFIMTHGLEGCVYGVDGHSMGVSKISKLFRPNNCPTLVDKPKIFFFQACQGENAMKGALSRSDIIEKTDIEHDSPPTVRLYDIPLEADFLIAHSTVPGYLAYRSRSEGSWFIRSLVDCMERYHTTDDLLSILIRVNNQMSMRPLKQMPMPIATLRKKIYLKLQSLKTTDDQSPASFTAVPTNDCMD